MIPTLLWRCPLCKTDDALAHRTRWFRPDLVTCSSCGTVWEVRRVPGDDYYLKVIASEASHVGQELPLAQWYDMLKAGLELVPISDPSLALEPNEVLYVKSEHAKLAVELDDPVFFPDETRLSPTEAPSMRKKVVGEGELFLTNERFIWRHGDRSHDFWLRKLNSAYTGIIFWFSILYELRAYRFSFKGESVLKWLTYVHQAAPRIKEVYDHDIELSRY